MNPTVTSNGQRVVKFVQELLMDEEDKASITPGLIEEKIDLVLVMTPKWAEGLDRGWVTDELIRRFSLWVGEDVTIVSNVGHEPWLDAARKRDWRYWQRYREWLEKRLSWKAVDALDVSTDKILGMLEDPERLGPWDRRGLVVGHVQSGKTGNYTGLVCKAADAQYKIIIVLAGLHNNLRSQTQMRLEEGFLGYDTSAARDLHHLIGVGEIDTDQNIHPNCATNRSNSGDFGKKVAKHLAISPEQRPWLFVVKKNKSVLSELLKWIQNHVADYSLPVEDDDRSGLDGLPRVRKMVTKLPLLIIDDEADHASVDTQEQVFDENGNSDDEHQPTTINRLIRRILHSFSRSAYVGYTATPFANIFIHERGETKQEGPDLFPAAFIQNLATPSNYVGPSTVFGMLTPEGRTGGLPLIREVDDHTTEGGTEGWMPQKHKSTHEPLWSSDERLPASLREAIESFVLTCAVRSLRGQGREHSSMLVHVTRFTLVQREVHSQVEEHIRHLRQRIVRGIDDEALMGRLSRLWHDDFLPATAALRATAPSDMPASDPAWEEVLAALPDAVNDIEVRMINGTAKDVLDYAENNGKGLKVIAIGGDKLARGLTLEGLCTSYFLRASKMYDTLMQMGRWFGYRPGYLDLCRLYTTSELVRWFGHISDAAAELREEFDVMAAAGATPREYGLKVQSHPVLMVTSRLKMRAAKNLMLSFSGQLLQTVSLFRTSPELEANLDTTKRLVSSLGVPDEVNPSRMREGQLQNWSGYTWSRVASEDICDFLFAFKTQAAAYRVNSTMLGEFIKSMAATGELTEWTVAVLGLQSGRDCELSSAVSIKMVTRAGDPQLADRYAIGVLLDPKDEALDLDESQWSAALAATKLARRSDASRPDDAKDASQPSGPLVRVVRGHGATGVPAHPERALLILYALDPQNADIGFAADAPPVIAFGISFPGSNSSLKVEYKVNNVLWEQEYGPSE